MSADVILEDLRDKAQESRKTLRGLCAQSDIDHAKSLIVPLRNARQYDLMGSLAEAISRHDPRDPENRRLYAQCLIETGNVTAAIDVLQALCRRLPNGHPERVEATGLLGRAYKQIFFDTGDKTSDGARRALKEAIAVYRRPYEADRRNTWHGVNLVALLTRARRLGLRIAPDLEPAAVARQLIDRLEAVPEDRRDEWHLPTLAEASLGLGDWKAVEGAISSYVAGPTAQAFLVASTLRQFTEVWDLEAVDECGRDIVAILRAALLALPGGELRVAPDELTALSRRSPSTTQLEAILGEDGPLTYRSMMVGLERCRSVASVRQRLGGRVGSGFLVRAGDLGLSPEDERLVITNWHVVNQEGAHPGIRPQEAEVVFEAADANRTCAVAEILWSSPVSQFDAALLRLRQAAAQVDPLPLAETLPVVEETTRVYAIGHPDGGELALSLQDNKLLDHEGPGHGKPQIPGVWRVHYRAPTKPGSSGSPVFNSRLWEVIALHHAGGPAVGRLNGKGGSYAANEGIAMGAIRQAIIG